MAQPLQVPFVQPMSVGSALLPVNWPDLFNHDQSGLHITTDPLKVIQPEVIIEAFGPHVGLEAMAMLFTCNVDQIKHQFDQIPEREGSQIPVDSVREDYKFIADSQSNFCQNNMNLEHVGYRRKPPKLNKRFQPLFL